jgi:hypothetical protein
MKGYITRKSLWNADQNISNTDFTSLCGSSFIEVDSIGFDDAFVKAHTMVTGETSFTLTMNFSGQNGLPASGSQSVPMVILAEEWALKDGPILKSPSLDLSLYE